MKEINTEMSSTWPSTKIDKAKVTYSTGIMHTAPDRYVTMYRLKGNGRILRERSQEPTELEINRLFKDNPDVLVIETEKVYTRVLVKKVEPMLDEAYVHMMKLGFTPTKFYLSQTLYDRVQEEWHTQLRQFQLGQPPQLSAIDREFARKYGTIQYYNDAEVRLLEEASDTGTLIVEGRP